MKFSAWPSVTNPWQDLLAEAEHIDRGGWHGLWIGDHFMAMGEQNGGPWGEAWTTLAAIAARTSRVRLGTLVTGNTYRHPAILAKQVAQVDHLSGGRVTLGIGAGWQENEHVAYDIPYYTPGERLARLNESVQIIRSLFQSERTHFEGKYYKIKNAPLSPKPVQARLPILVGGGGEKVTLRIVAQHADAWNVAGPPELVAAKGKVLDAHCERLGRDPASVWRTGAMLVTFAGANLVSHLPGWVTVRHVRELSDRVAAYADAGVHELIIHFNPGRPLAARKETLSAFMEEVAPQFQ
jgi:F420-dependent oxidoreductase-like protein